jgi:uncharacterized membrane protein YkvI
LIGLIARGYGTLTWLFLLVYVIPILTWGLYLIRSKAIERASAAGGAALSDSSGKAN